MSKYDLFYLLTISIGPLFPRRRLRLRTIMMFPLLTVILGCLLAVQCREASKPFKTMPTITGSLVNLGKMDISFHFNSKDSIPKFENQIAAQHSFLFPKSEPIVEEPCPCSGLRGMKDNHPSNLLNKILTSGDLFSHKEPTSSTLCCGSHEAQEEIVTFEFGPKDGMPMTPHQMLPKLPFIFENIFPKRPPLSRLSQMPNKAKTVEIFLFPKKKDGQTFMPIKKDSVKKENSIQAVGDKELRNDFKTLKLRPSFPLNFQSSVKKDLTAQEKNEINKQPDKEEIDATTANTNN